MKPGPGSDQAYETAEKARSGVAAKQRWWTRLALDVDPLRQSAAFRSLYLARSVSMLSIAVLAVAVAWQVYGISASSIHVAGVGIGLALGSLVGLVWGGTLADRADRRRIMIRGRAAYVAVVAILWANSLRAEPGLPEIYLATLLSGLTSGISAPALMAAMPKLIPPRHLAAAGALNALSMELSRLIGPLIAGALLAHYSIALCYGVVLIGAALVPLLLARLPKDLLQPDAGAKPGPASRPSMLAQWLDGLKHVRHNGVIACLLALDLAMMLFASVHALMPQLGQTVLQGGPEMVGYLYAAPAFGALVVALTSGWTRRLTHPGRLVIACALLWGIAIALAGVAAGGLTDGLPWGAWAVLAFLAVSGMADTASDIIRGALLQIHTPDTLRGRVSGLWLLQGYMGPALGGLQAGGLATLWSPGRALIAGGSACTAVVALFLAMPNGRLRKHLWRLEE
ncbi:MFS transporter [Alcaligenaceae bacterium]|nr:MFS transporter [Alcaligenaceae bacterium]